MGGSSSKRFFWQKKKSPVEKAWSQLTGALPIKKRKRRKSVLSLDKLKKDKKHSQKRFSLQTDKKEPTPLKRLSVGNARKESVQAADGGGLGKVGEQIKRRFSQDPKKGINTHQEVVCPSVNLKSKKEENETNGQKNGAKESKKRLDEFVRSIRP